MTIEEAMEHLKDEIQKDGGLYSLGRYLYWSNRADNMITLDGEFSVDELEAIVAYVRDRLRW